ncbi:adhesin transport system outer membrane protein [Acinetobacter calcoaceticus]|uniref:Adhesin transport system outer membrane protein n=1 Tax=Acinetobacter calcoaceticus TaxID=471 RepID=A0A4R1XLZ7_ACICA|nr:adhesin transport system outer membrane protein [Acinetobacter calcoaceticus]
MQMKKRFTIVVCLSLGSFYAFWGTQAHALSLQDILKQSLVNDPAMQEAKANIAYAHSTMQATQAEHYPVVSLMGTQVLGQQHKYESNARETNFAPGLRASVNLYAWGGIEAAVDRDKKKESYFQHISDQTREDLGYKISSLYLTALRAKESLVVAERNLARHDKMLHDLNIIVKHDPGRRSELVQAQARRLRVETGISELRRTLGLAISRLGVYTQDFLQPDSIVDPFKSIRSQDLIQDYRQAEYERTPSYLAQKAERESALADMKASQAARMPALNLEGTASEENSEVYLRVSWDIFNQASKHKVAQKNQSMLVAESRLQQTLRDSEERSRTAVFDMTQNEQRAQLASQYISAQKEVVWSYEQQFKIARRTLIDVLDAYNELANIEAAEVAARNDFRDATLEYLLAQARIATWAGVATPSK